MMTKADDLERNLQSVEADYAEMQNPHTVRVTGEYFRVQGERYETPTAAIAAAYKTMGEETALNCLSVQRVTLHEPIDLGVFGTRSETVTGEVVIQGVTRIARTSTISRWHPNNGWCVPETITVD